MADITTKSKWAFWAMILAVVVFSTVPSWVLIEKLSDYYFFLSGSEVTPLKSTKDINFPHRSLSKSYEPPDIHFVEFRLAAAGARKVGLAASFNGWHSENMPLQPETRGEWKVVVPLPPGTYRYAFDVDGSWIPDPATDRTDQHRGRKVSIKKVP